jgi:copper homeostasis protein
LLIDFKLEICADSVESAIEAQSAGTDQILFCSNIFKEGITPGFGSFIAARNNL